MLRICEGFAGEKFDVNGLIGGQLYYGILDLE